MFLLLRLDELKDEELKELIYCQQKSNILSTKKELEAPDWSFALIRALQCCIFFLRIELHPFQIFAHLLCDSLRYTNALTVYHCSLRYSSVTISS